MKLKCSREKAFSLVEVLVVSTIIAILAALLCGVVAGAKRHARARTCTEKLSAIGKAIALYQSDNDDNLPVIAPREGLIYGPEGTQPKVSPDPLEPYGLTAESYQCDLSQKAPRLKGVSDYFFRFVLDFSSVNGNKEKSLRLEPTPTSVLAWDPNHGSIDANKEPHALWIALRADDSVFTVPRSQVKESYFVNGHWTFTKPAGLNSSVFVPTEWVFPNETWPPNAEPYLP